MSLEAQRANRMDANRHSGHGSKHNIRLSRVATDALTAWIEANQAHPYPNDSDKASLQAETRLSHRQINNWAQGRQKVQRAAKKQAAWLSNLSKEIQEYKTNTNLRNFEKNTLLDESI